VGRAGASIHCIELLAMQLKLYQWSIRSLHTGHACIACS